jgi:hypothetical protein
MLCLLLHERSKDGVALDRMDTGNVIDEMAR